MAFTAVATLVSTSAITAVVTSTGYTEVFIEPKTGATLYLGGAAVTSSDGFPLSTASHQPFHVVLPNTGEIIYAVASSSALAYVLKQTPF